MIGRFPGETSCLTMAWAVVDLVIAGSRGLESRQVRAWNVRDAGPRPGPAPASRYTRPVTRDELILRTRQLIAEGERLDADPSMTALQAWLQLSDDLLATAWGTMDRYHLAWLMVGKPKATVRGREMSPDEAAAYVREVASAKRATLRMSLDAVERQRMPFRGETGGIGAGLGMGMVPGSKLATAEADAASVDDDAAEADVEADAEANAETGSTTPLPAPSRNRQIPLDPELAARLDDVRRAAAQHATHEPITPSTPAQRRAPRPERLQH